MPDANLLLSETDGLLDGPEELALQRVESLVRWQVEPVEARVTLRQLRLLARLLDSEATRSIGALQILEAVDGDTGSAGRELQETRFLFRVPAPDALCYDQYIIR